MTLIHNRKATGMIALIFRDQYGHRVELFKSEEEAEERFYESQIVDDPDMIEQDYEDDVWRSSDGQDACHVIKGVKAPPEKFKSFAFILLWCVCFFTTALVTFVVLSE